MSQPPAWHFSVSSTVRGIYVLRYFLFAGGLAIAGALVERTALGGDRSLAGFATGLAAGLLIFRAQLRALRWPTLAISQDAVYLIRRKTATVISWDSIAEIVDEGPFVTLQLRTPLSSPDGEAVQQIRLETRKFGTSHVALLEDLRRYARAPAARTDLPDDARLRRLLAMPP
jgi:hypothetical protein